MTKPLISVIMTVYNGEKYLDQAIDSILSQSYKHFELIIVNDGSTDNTLKVINSYKDSRIVLISQRNQGVSKSCNKAIKLVKGDYIARHDADDISSHKRFEKQVCFLINNKDVSLVGSNLRTINSKGKFNGYVDLLTNPDDLKLATVFSNQIAQGSVMMRREVLSSVGNYDPKYTIVHDYDLWVRIAHKHKITNLKDRLYTYRVHDESLSTSPGKIKETRSQAFEIVNREFNYYLSHKKEYKRTSFHPFSMRGGLKPYLERKAAIYRDMAWMYTNRGMRKKALPAILVATAHYPWDKRNYQQLFLTMTNRQAALNLEYELF